MSGKSCNFLCCDLFCHVRLEIMKNVGNVERLLVMSLRPFLDSHGYLGYSGEIAATFGTRGVDGVQIFD